MNLRLHDIELPLAHFDLILNLECSRAVTGIFGASGAGKTSLLEVIAGLRKPRLGLVQFDKTVLCDAQKRVFVPPRSRRMGYVPQDGAIFPHLSVRGNLLYGARREAAAGFDLEHVASVLEIAPLLERGAAELSGGEKQRVACARAMLSQPKLLLLDEPFSALDQPLREKAVALLQRVRAEFGVPMIFVSHLADEVATLCDEVVVLERGRCAGRGRPTEIFTATPTMAWRLNASRLTGTPSIG
ncbi:MAG: ATP-binding cassette domain-containing protein [Verrucomicrobia bacterium]|nr:ATP-binding cassette domain-containing protein [Verrucomicrobiota bacterium]MDE3097881.1 ATP-binding cassette domain-containing protein [Verrucomicrobiota bacterium]